MQVDGAVKRALLEAMDELHRVCEENGLKYYLIGGSLIGAVRHQGCIPWDDDLDVVMFKKDFKELISLSQNFEEKYSLHYRCFPDSMLLPIARVENNSVIIDEGYFSEKTAGVFVDIFCFQNTFDSKFMQIVHFKLVTLARLLFRFKERSYSKIKYTKKLLYIFDFISKMFFIFPKKLLNNLMSIFEALGCLKKNKLMVANLHGCWGIKEVAPKTLFQKRKLYNFEGRQYWSIENADAWLRPIYGDYMKLPPIEDRRPKHIDKVISINGVRVDS